MMFAGYNPRGRFSSMPLDEGPPGLRRSLDRPGNGPDMYPGEENAMVPESYLEKGWFIM